MAKAWRFNFNISPSNEYSGLISFRMSRFDLLADQETLKSFLQQHSSKTSILQCSPFFVVQLSHPYMTTGETIVLTIQTFVIKVIISLVFNMLSRFLSSKEQASFNFVPTFIICSDFEAQENKVCHCFYCFPIYFPWSDGTNAMVPWAFIFWMLSFKPTFHLPLSPSSGDSLVPLNFLP